EGDLAIAAMCTDEPGVLIGAHRGRELHIGIHTSGHLLVSDPAACGHLTSRFVTLADEEVAVVVPDGYYILDSRRGLVGRHELRLDELALDTELDGFPHYMLKEIHQQPAVLRNAMDGRLIRDQASSVLRGLGLDHTETARIERLVLVGCGSSRYAAGVGKCLIEDLAGVFVDVELAGEFDDRRRILPERCLVGALSQSGETAATLAAVREARRRGARVFGIVNVPHSSLARECGRGICLNAGPEISMAATKSFTSQVVVLALLALYLGRERGLSIDRGHGIIADLEALAGRVSDVLGRPIPHAVIDRLAGASSVFYLGRRYNHPVAEEGALKLKEVSYVHAEGLHADEVRHGPLATLEPGRPVVAIATAQTGIERMLHTVQAVRSRQAPVVLLATDGYKEAEALAEHVLYLPPVPEYLSPVTNVVMLQRLAYEVAKARGCEIDRPRSLVKSVSAGLPVPVPGDRGS
ncbi:MAG: isomerizing glutamine--fructose-6-phosphate transaminase, partial [Candidatus Krumholzibacteriia bacterium]